MHFLNELRDATRKAHQRLHLHPLLGKLLSERVDLPDYLRVLESFYGFYRPLETKLARASDRLRENTGWTGPLRTRWLEEDLLCLGHRLSSLRRLPTCRELPRLSNPCHLWGSLYVMEGATLGGQIIAAHLQDRFGLGMTSGCRFFTSYGEAVWSRWTNFQERIHARADSRSFRLGTIAAAGRLFEAIETWLHASMVGAPREQHVPKLGHRPAWPRN